MGLKIKPKQVTDKTVEPKAVWGKIRYNKKTKVTYLYNSKLIDVSDIVYTIDSEELFNIFPWMLEEID